MNPHNYIHKIHILLLSFFLFIFVLLSINSLLPLKWRFPSWRLSPHLDFKYEQSSSGTTAYYINKDGIITVALDKNYAAINTTIIDRGENGVIEQYMDDHGNPAILLDGYSAIRKEYNNEGLLISSTYLDDKLIPVVCKFGYATVRRTFYNNGKVETEMYYDNIGLPTRDTSKRYGVRYIYNDESRISIVMNLDADGDLIDNNNQFAYCKRTYTPDGRLFMERYFDKNGNPTKLTGGQYGYIYENGKAYCVDQDGHKVFMLRHFLLSSLPLVLLIGISLVLLSVFSNNTITWIIICLYFSFIIYMTFINRGHGNSIIAWSIPPNYYLFITDKDILANIWLFIPFGTILYKLSHMWIIIAIPIVLSLVIESSQFIFEFGSFELSDLIANSLGGIIGIASCYLFEWIVKKSDAHEKKFSPFSGQ